MRPDCNLLAEMRAALRAQLPPRAFLRRCRGEALFVSNAPRFDPEIREISGFCICIQDGLMHILPSDAWILRLEEAESADDFSRSLMRFRGQAPDQENRRIFAQGLKLLELAESAPAAEIRGYDRALRQRAAVALRGGCGGGLYAAALIRTQLPSIKGD